MMDVENYCRNIACITITMFPRLQHDASRSRKGRKMFQSQTTALTKEEIKLHFDTLDTKRVSSFWDFVARKIPMFVVREREERERERSSAVHVRRISGGARGGNASPLRGAWPRFSTLRNRKNYCPETSLWRRAACNPWLQAERCVRVRVSRDSWTTVPR